MNHLINQTLINTIQPNYINAPLAVFLIGANGSGKSTLRNYLNLSDIQTNIDPDVLNRIFKNKYPQNYIFESARCAITMYQQSIKNEFNVCIESTLAGHGTMDRIIQAKNCGYFIIGYFVGLNNVELNLVRIKNRVALGGHDIPKNTVLKRYHESMDNLTKIKNYFNELHIIDNSFTAYQLQLSKYQENIIQHTSTLEDWVTKLSLGQP